MLKSIFTNSSGILFSRVLGFIRDLLTAQVLGASVYSDIFFVAFKLPNLFRRIVGEGAFTQAFLPAFTRARHKSVFSIHVFRLFLAAILVVTLAVNLFPRAGATMIAVGFDAATLSQAAPYVALNIFYLPLIFAVTYLATFLQYKHHFATPAFSTGLLNIGLIVALLLSEGQGDETIVYYMSYGVLVGGMLQLAVHLLAIYRLGLHRMLIGGVRHYGRKISKTAAESRRFFKSFFPAVWGNAAPQFAAFLDTWLASFLGAGVISYLYYANRIFQLPLALFAIATSVALFPRVARFLKHADTAQATQMLSRAFLLLLYLLGMSMIGGIILAHEIIGLLFERGAFTHAHTLETAAILQMYMIGLLPFGLGKLFSLWLYAEQRQNEAARIATWSLGSNTVLSLLLIVPLEGAGLALASSVGGLVALVMTLRALGGGVVLAIMRPRPLLLWLIAMALFTLLIFGFKELIHAYL